VLLRERPAQLQEPLVHRQPRQELNVRVLLAPIHAHQAVTILLAIPSQEQLQVRNITVVETHIKAQPQALIIQEPEEHPIPIQDLQRIQDQLAQAEPTAVLHQAQEPLPADLQQVAPVIQDHLEAVQAQAIVVLPEAAVQVQAIAVLPEAVAQVLAIAVLPEAAARAQVTAVPQVEEAAHQEAATAVDLVHQAAGQVHLRQEAVVQELQDHHPRLPHHVPDDN